MTHSDRPIAPKFAKVPDGTEVMMARKKLVFGQTICQLEDSNHLIGDISALRQQIDSAGYLLLRGFFDSALISRARTEILNYMSSQGTLQQGAAIDQAVASSEQRGVRFTHSVVQQLPGFLEVVNSDQILSFFDSFLGGPSMSLDHKWLRATPPGQNTGAHYDVVYMGAGSKKLYTVWTALDDIPLEMGPLAVCLGSHQHQRLRETYGASDAHQDLLEGSFSHDPYELMEKLGFRWASAPFQAGDIIIFGMYLMHGSLDNMSARFRLSCDTRYQLADDAVDWRHMGEIPDQIPKAEGRISIQDARANWGI